MTDGTIPSVVVPDGDGVPRRYSRLSDVWAHRDQLAGVIRLPDLAEQLGVRYDEIYRMPATSASTSNSTPPTASSASPTRKPTLSGPSTQRVRALHRRSMKLPAAARQLKLTFSTVRLLAIRATSSSTPRPTPAAPGSSPAPRSRACWLARNEAKRRKAQPVATVPFAEVVRFTGLGRRAVVDLIRAGVLEELPGRRSSCEITTTSLEAWLADNGSALSAAIAPTSVSAAEREQ